MPLRQLKLAYPSEPRYPLHHQRIGFQPDAVFNTRNLISKLFTHTVVLLLLFIFHNEAPSLPAADELSVTSNTAISSPLRRNSRPSARTGPFHVLPSIAWNRPSSS